MDQFSTNPFRRLNYLRNDPFPHPTESSSHGSPLHWREKCIRLFSVKFRDDPNWIRNLEDKPAFVRKLREACEKDSWLNGKAVAPWRREEGEFVWRELVERYRPFVLQSQRDQFAAQYCQTSDVRTSGGGMEPHIDAVWRSDFLVDDGLRQRLIEAVKTLEDIPESQKLWHPGTNKQVLNLVHPSYWPIIYGKTRSSDGKVIQPPEESQPDPPGYRRVGPRIFNPENTNYSRQFCWLPSEFHVSENGKVRVVSYINNLVLEEQENLFVPILEKIFEGFVPMFNNLLADLREKKQDLKRVKWDAPFVNEGRQMARRFQFGNDRGAMKEGEESFSRPSAEITKEWENFLRRFERGEPVSTSKEWMEELERTAAESIDTPQEHYQWLGSTFKRKPSERLTGQMWSPPTPDVLEKVKLEGRTLKVIVKLANIVLTPEKPAYTGGGWHVEAMGNERVVATGIYYYQQENITPSTLGFRRALDVTDQDKGVYDFDTDDFGIQEIGDIDTKEKRAVVFPNIYQHRVNPFELVDKTKPGYRKILVFFLCDPARKFDNAPTTRTVPPQQPEYAEQALQVLQEGTAAYLPNELVYEIKGHLPSVISRNKALEYVDQLMQERAVWGNDSRVVLNGRPGRYWGATD